MMKWLGWIVAVIMTVACVQIHRRGEALIEKCSKTTEGTLATIEIYKQIVDKYKQTTDNYESMAEMDATMEKGWKKAANDCMYEHRKTFELYKSALAQR